MPHQQDRGGTNSEYFDGRERIRLPVAKRSFMPALLTNDRRRLSKRDL